jgi:hypothetical protein
MSHLAYQHRADDPFSDVLALTRAVVAMLRTVWNGPPKVCSVPDFAASLPDFATVLAAPLLRPPFISMLDDGFRTVPLSRYCSRIQVSKTSKPEIVLDRARVHELLDEGVPSCKLNRMELWEPCITAAADALGKAFGKRVKVWGFLSQEGRRMLPPHRDPGHNLAVQTSGDKDWLLGDAPPDAYWSKDDPLTGFTSSQTLRVEQGNALYMSHGYSHQAVAHTGRSFHLAFAFHGPTKGDLGQYAIQCLRRNVISRHSGELDPDTFGPACLDAGQVCRGLAHEFDALAKRDWADPGEIAAFLVQQQSVDA